MKVKTGVIIGISIAVVVVILLFLSVLYFGDLTPSAMKSESLIDSTMSISGSKTRPYEPPSDMRTQQADALGTDGESAFTNMNFKDYGTNIFINTADDSLSTFALDVDTASYTIAKNYLLRGELPPVDAIRPEEFINYFKYGYPSPQDGFAIYPTMVSSPYDADKHFIRIGIKTADAPAQSHVKLTLVVDVSGSMTIDNRSGLVKRSIEYLLTQLDDDDEIAIVKYNTDATTVLEHTKVSDTATIAAAIDELRPSGPTNVQSGLTLGYSLARDAYNADAQNRVVLFSDGVANDGETGPEALIEQLAVYAQEGIALTAVGFGLGNYNDELMETIANGLDGNYAYINEFSEISRVFGDNLFATLYTIAKDAKVQVEFNPQFVSLYRLVGYENRALADDKFTADAVDAGEIGAGHEVTAVYEVVFDSKRNMNLAENIATVHIRYEDVVTSESKEVMQFVRKEHIFNSFAAAPKELRLAVTAARFAQILKHSAPPPQIDLVASQVNALQLEGEEELEYGQIVQNAQRLIELSRGR